MRKELVHNILGTPYIVEFGDRSEIVIDDNNLGECKVYKKKILVCTEKYECDEIELEARTQEVLAHEIFHAYANEVGLDLDDRTEEMVANFFMKNWRKTNDSILEILDVTGFLDK